MIKQNLLSTKKMKSGLNVMGLFGSIVMLLLFKKAGKNLFNFTTPTLDDDNSYVSITNENVNVESIEKFKSGGTKQVKDRQTLANINLAIPLLLLLPCFLLIKNSFTNVNNKILIILFSLFFGYIFTFFILNMIDNEDFYSHINNNQIFIFIVVSLFTIIYLYYQKRLPKKFLLITFVTLGILIFITTISSNKLWQEDENFKKARPIPIHNWVSGGIFILSLLLVFFGYIMIYKSDNKENIFKMLIGMVFAFWIAVLITNYILKPNDKDKYHSIINRSTEFINLFFSILLTGIFLLPNSAGLDSRNFKDDVGLLFASISMVTSLISYIVSLNKKTNDKITTFTSKLFNLALLLGIISKYVIYDYDFEMNIPNGKGILKFKSIIQKEPIFILSGLGIFLFIFIFGTSFTYRYNEKEMRDYDNFNNEQEDEEKHKSLGGSNSIYKRYNNTVYNFKKNIEEKNGFLSRELNNIKNLVLSGKAYYAVDSNDYNNNYKKFVEDNLEKSGSIEWNKTIVIFGLFLASILTYGFSKMSMTEMNSKYIKGFFIVINLVIAITYNILFKENADNYKNLVKKIPNSQFY